MSSPVSAPGVVRAQSPLGKIHFLTYPNAKNGVRAQQLE
jgi:hypothetical protein